eukprot:2193272-Prymnesium_polylepis.1
MICYWAEHGGREPALDALIAEGVAEYSSVKSSRVRGASGRRRAHGRQERVGTPRRARWRLALTESTPHAAAVC